MKKLTKQDEKVLSGAIRKKKPYVAMAMTNLEMEVVADTFLLKLIPAVVITSLVAKILLAMMIVKS